MTTESKTVSQKKIFHSWFIDEIPLYFGNNVKDVDPKRGITVSGPVEFDSSKPELLSIKIGIIGTGEGIHEVKHCLKELENEINNENKQPFLRPPFSGLQKSFRCKFITDENWEQLLRSSEIKDILKTDAFDLRVKRASDTYSKKVRNICDKTSRPDVIICHQTEDIEKKVGAGTLTADRSQGRLKSDDKKYYQEIKRKSEMYELLAPLDDDTQNMLDMLIPSDFRRMLKAECLQYDIPTQIIANSTIKKIITARERKEIKSGDDPATTAWNLAVALYYKAGHFPWKVAGLRTGTCYIGISFYHDRIKDEKYMQTSLAQIFTDTGEGLILKGDRFKLDKSKGYEPHLDEESSYKLLHEAIQLYKDHKGQLPERIVIHKTSTFNENEISGFDKAQKGISYYDYITIRKSDGINVYRNGENAVLRGLVIDLEKNKHLVFTKGYVPYLRAYPGLRTPRPLLIAEHHGDSTPEELVREIMSLTRLNWNTMAFSCSWPMTLQFSRAVGDVLARVPDGQKIQNQYRFYM